MSEQTHQKAETALAEFSGRGIAKAKGGFRPGEREFYGGLAAITICCAIAMMRGGPEVGYAATTASHPQVIEPSNAAALKSPAVEQVEHASNTRVRALR